VKPSHRFSIARLMGVVLATSIGLTALRYSSATWAALMFLVASGVVALGLVGVVCCKDAGRAWWLGFVLFGGGYLALAFCPDFELAGEPAVDLVSALSPYLGIPTSPSEPFGQIFPDGRTASRRIIHCFVSLIVAVIGGLSAHVLFAAPLAEMVRIGTGQPQADRCVARWWRWPLAVGLAGVVAFTATTVIGARDTPGLWTGATVLLTWALLGLTAIGALFRRGPRQAQWLGAALFGIGYLLLVSGRSDQQTWPQFATNRLLNTLRPWFPPIATGPSATSDPIIAANARAQKFLDRTIPMPFPEETALEQILNHIRTETREPNGRMIPIYVDPVGLQEAEKTLKSPAKLDLDGVPLRTTLRLVMQQLGMNYKVTSGLILISDIATCAPDEDLPAQEDPLLLIGQCLLALLAAGLGSLLAPLVANPGSGQADARA